MADPLSVAAGIAGLLTLSAQVAKIVGQWTVGISSSHNAVQSLLGHLKTLDHVLKQLVDFLAKEDAKASSFDQTSVLCSAINSCRDRLQSLLDRLAKPTKGNKIRQGYEMLKWPLTDRELRQTAEDLHRYVQTFQFSLNIDGW